MPCGIEFERTLGDYTLKQIVGAQNREAPTANAGRIHEAVTLGSHDTPPSKK